MLNVDPQDMRESRGLKTFKIKDVISPHHGKMAEAIRPKICIEINLSPELVNGAFFQLKLLQLEFRLSLKYPTYFFQP